MSTGKQEGAVESPLVTQDRLPFLPGYRIQTMPKEKYHKTHMFEVSNGVRCDVNRDGALLDQRSFPLSATHPLAVTKGASDRSVDMKASAESTMSRLPSWVAYDRKVLRFYGWFEEPVHSSPEETFRVRKCVFCYYLEDDSVHIGEPKIENSGIPQGVLIKRHRIPKADNSYIGIDDLSVGAELTIYGRVYHITDCDEFTRTFYQNAGKPQGEAQEVPQDEFAKKKAKGQPKMTMYGQHKDYVEASLGKTVVNVPATKKFLANDGKVLRFYCQWDDKNMFGEKRPYILNYFLADDTCAVLEIPTPNSGRDNWSAMVKRARLPKDNLNNLDMSKIGQGVDKNVRYYTDADLRIGDTILVFGRPLFLCGCDQFTKEYYISNYGMTEEDFPRLNMEEEKITLPEIVPPPYNGFGNEEDSLGSYLHLMPKIPKPDFKKLMENEGKKMGFLAEWAEPPAGEKARRFVITFYLNNDQVAVFERPERNSGFHGGKFLERTRFKNPKTNLWYQPQDFQIGAEVTINTFRFRILAADDFTKQYMAEHPDQFPHKQAGAGATVSFDATATSPVNTQTQAVRGPSPKNTSTSSITASVGAQIAGQGQGSVSPSARKTHHTRK